MKRSSRTDGLSDTGFSIQPYLGNPCARVPCNADRVPLVEFIIQTVEVYPSIVDRHPEYTRSRTVEEKIVVLGWAGIRQQRKVSAYILEVAETHCSGEDGPRHPRIDADMSAVRLHRKGEDFPGEIYVQRENMQSDKGLVYSIPHVRRQSL